MHDWKIHARTQIFWVLGAFLAVVLLLSVIFDFGGMNKLTQTEAPDEPGLSQQEPSVENEPAALQGVKNKAEAQTAVSFLAALAYLSLASAKDLSCLMGDMLHETNTLRTLELSELRKTVVIDYLSELEKQCAVYTEMEGVIRPFVEESIKNGKVPKEYYVFAIFEPGEAYNTWTEVEIGIFPSLADCQRFEHALHELDVPTLKCEVGSLRPLTLMPQLPSPPIP